MNAAIDALVLFLVLIVGVWTIGFGLLGMTIAHSSRIGALSGFTVGAVFGPFGLAWLWWRSRRVQRDEAEDPRTTDGLRPREETRDRGLPL